MNTVFESTLPETAPVAVLGVPFDPVTISETLEIIGRMVASRRPHQIVTANVDFLVQAREDVELRRILLDAHLVLCDGTPVRWASKLLGNPLPERVAGADLVPRLIRIAAEKKLRLFFLGGTNDSMARAIANVKAMHPGIVIEGYSPPFHPLLEMDHEEIKTRIAAARPDLLFVAFGCPKQEKWIAMHYQSLGVPVAIGVGGTIDFLAGHLKRAPIWMQRTGTEWLFRLAQEPRRLFRRYARDLGMFGWLLLAQWFLMQFLGKIFPIKKSERSESCRAANRSGLQHVLSRTEHKKDDSTLAQNGCEPGRLTSPGFVPRVIPNEDLKPRGSAAVRLKSDVDWQWIQLPLRLDAYAVRNDALLCDRILVDGRHCLLQMDSVKFIDSTGLGWLLRLQKKIRAAGRNLILIAPQATMNRDLELLHLADYFECARNFASAMELLRKQPLGDYVSVRGEIPPHRGRGSEENLISLFAAEEDSSSPTSPQEEQIVSWRGEITAANAATVWQETERLIRDEASYLEPITIDLSQVRFMDSSGVGLMVRAQKLARHRGVTLTFAGAQPAVENVLRLSGLENFLLGELA